MNNANISNYSTAPAPPTMLNTYQNAGFSPELVAITGIRLSIGLIGMCFNLSLVYVTIHTKAFHAYCNLLLALNAACEIGYQLGLIPAFVAFVMGTNFMPLWECVAFILVPAFLFVAAFTLLTAVAVDRLYAVAFPINYNKRSNILWVGTIAFCFVAYGSMVPILTAKNLAEKNPNLPMVCTHIGIMGSYSLYATVGNLFFVFFAALLYVLIGWKIFSKSNDANSSAGRDDVSTVRPFFKSLAGIVFVELTGYGITAGANSWMTYNKVDDLHFFFYSNTIAVVHIISTGASPVILYTFSSKYRKAYHKLFPMLKKMSATNIKIFINNNSSSMQTRTPVEILKSGG